ncbi:hypothetical protein PENTCL1PPCAC_18558, partial [Pristionchus entomophagus]
TPRSIITRWREYPQNGEGRDEEGWSDDHCQIVDGTSLHVEDVMHLYPVLVFLSELHLSNGDIEQQPLGVALKVRVGGRLTRGRHHFLHCEKRRSEGHGAELNIEGKVLNGQSADAGDVLGKIRLDETIR